MKKMSYYCFDWDDNILYMPTVLHFEYLNDNDEWEHRDVSTQEFALMRKDRTRWKQPEDCYWEFRDYGKRKDRAFIEDTISALKDKKFGPSWNDFIRCLINGTYFAIITARGHEQITIRKGVEYIINNVLSKDEQYMMFFNLKKYEYMFDDDDEDVKMTKDIFTDEDIVKRYLDMCYFIGVSCPSIIENPDAANPEKEKKKALMTFIDKIQKLAKKYGYIAKIGFSDDDKGNVKSISDLIDQLDHEKFSNISECCVIDTSNKVKNKTYKKIKTYESYANGLVGFSNFGNQTNHYYNNNQYSCSNDDRYTQFRQNRYLVDISNELFDKDLLYPLKDVADILNREINKNGEIHYNNYRITYSKNRKKFIIRKDKESFYADAVEDVLVMVNNKK